MGAHSWAMYMMRRPSLVFCNPIPSPPLPKPPRSLWPINRIFLLSAPSIVAVALMYVSSVSSLIIETLLMVSDAVQYGSSHLSTRPSKQKPNGESIPIATSWGSGSMFLDKTPVNLNAETGQVIQMNHTIAHGWPRSIEPVLDRMALGIPVRFHRKGTGAER